MLRATQAQTAHFILQKNFLTTPAADLIEMVAQLGGLPAQPLLTPHLAALSRLLTYRPAELMAALEQERRLIMAELMRGQPYLLPVDQFPLYHAATARQRRQNLNSEFRLWDLENAEVEQLGQAILAELGDEPATVETIAARLPARHVRELRQTSRGGRVSTTSNVALALHWLTATGLLYAGRDPATGLDWRSERVVYAPLRACYPDLDLNDTPDEATAQATVVRSYLAVFGPASEADISFWTGFGKSETARAINALSRETTLVLVEGLPGMMILLKAQAETLTATEPPATPQVKLLPADDPYSTAHRASRSRYFTHPAWQRQVFSNVGAAQPTILINGQMAGVWQVPPAGQPPTWHWLGEAEQSFGGEIEAEVEAQLARLAAFFG